MAIKSNPLGVLIAKARSQFAYLNWESLGLTRLQDVSSNLAASTIKCDISQTERVVKHTGFLEAFSFIYIWRYGITVIISDCLSEDQVSTTCSVAIGY